MPPKLNTASPENQQTNFTVNLGSGVVLPCEVEGDPLPDIVWFKDEIPISMTDLHYFITQDGSLEIFSSDSTDTGQYRCRASNVVGDIDKTVSLFVRGIYKYIVLVQLALVFGIKGLLGKDQLKSK